MRNNAFRVRAIHRNEEGEIESTVVHTITGDTFFLARADLAARIHVDPDDIRPEQEEPKR